MARLLTHSSHQHRGGRGTVPLSYVVNLSTVYRHLPRDERPAAAAAAGFTRVESWWEFSSATPTAADVDRFLSAIRSAKVALTAVNAYGGDQNAAERGLACLPGRQREFEQSIEGIVEMNRHTGADCFNVTMGYLEPSRWSPDEQFAIAAERYEYAASRVAPFGGTILIEPLTTPGNAHYPFRTGYDVADFLDDHLPNVPNVGILLDVFHLASNGIDILRAIEDLAPRISHVQLADHPGRGQPGSGTIDFDAVRRALDRVGYTGRTALEYLG